MDNRQQASIVPTPSAVGTPPSSIYLSFLILTFKTSHFPFDTYLLVVGNVTCHRAHGEVREKRMGINSLLPLCGS